MPRPTRPTPACRPLWLLTAAMLATATLTASAFAQPAGFPLQRWLDEPHIKLVAVEFYADWCAPCKASAPKWEALRKRYAAQGLKLVVVNVDAKDPNDKRCRGLPWRPDVSICDPAIGKRLGVKGLPEAFVWSWQGNLLVSRGQHVGEIERIITRYLNDNPRVQVEAVGRDGKPDRVLRRLVQGELGRYGKLTVVADAEMRARLARLRKASHRAAGRTAQRCKLGAEVSANSLLRAERFAGALSLALLDAVTNCQRARVSVSWDARGAERTVDKAVFQLMAGLKRQQLQMPAGVKTARRQVVETEKRDTGAGDWTPEGDELAMVKFVSEPAGAMVMVDNKPLCQTPCTKALSAGNHRVAMHKPQYVSRDESARLAAGSLLSWTLTPDFALLTVQTEPAGVAVTVDGKSVTAGEALQLSPGRHKLVAQDRCHAAHSKTVGLKRGEQRVEVLRPVVKPAGLMVLVSDGRGSDVQGAEVWVDGVRAGPAFKALKVAACAKEAEVRHRKLGSAKVTLSLVERKTTKVKATLGAASGGVGGAVSAGKQGIAWVRLPGGTFSMGSNDGEADEKPVHRVTVSGFELAKTEVTVRQYSSCVAAGRCTKPKTGKYCNWGRSGREAHPINCVDWNQAVAFSRWVGGRLPTEAEWEYAARSGGRPWRYPWGSSPAPDCRRVVMDDGRTTGSAGSETDGCGRDSTWPVCAKVSGKTRQGLCDMIGNVWEWTSDWYGKYSNGHQRDPKGAAGGSYRVYRGCGWYDTASYCRAANRGSNSPSHRDNDLGFRPARSIP